MENFLLLMNSTIDLWKIHSSVWTVIEMSFAILCGVGIFFLLLPFLKEYPGSPTPYMEKDILKVMKRGQYKDSKKSATGKGCRNSQKNVSPPMESPIQHPLLDSFPHPFWNSKEKLSQLSLPYLFSYLKVLEVLIQQNFCQLLWGISSVLSESVVATAWVSRNSLGGSKTVRFCESSEPIQALSLDTETPELFQDQQLPHKPGAQSLVGVIDVQEPEHLPNCIRNQTTSSFQRKAHRKTGRTSEIGIQTSLPTLNEPWQQKLNWKDIADCDIHKCQAAISQPIDNVSRDTLPTKNITSTSVFPEHCQMIHHHKEPQHDKTINFGEQQGTHIRFLPSRELTQLQGDSQPNSDGYCKNAPEFNQPDQFSILGSKNYKWNHMVGSVPTRVPLKKAFAKCNILNTTKKSLRAVATDLTCTSSSTPEKGLELKNPAVRTDELISINTSKGLSFLDPNTKLKLESNIIQLPVKQRKFPCASKAEYYSKAAMILEKLHLQDPGGTRVETLSSYGVQSPVFEHSPPDVQETQGASPSASRHGPSKTHQYQQQKYITVQPLTFCFQAKHKQSRTIWGTGRGILPPNTSPGMTKYVPWNQSEDVVSGYPSLNTTNVGTEDRGLPSLTKQTHTLKVKEEASHAWRVWLGSNEIPNGQAINITLKDFESAEAKRNPSHMQTRTLQNSGDLSLKIRVYNNIDSSEQPQAWPVSHHPDGPKTVCPAMVGLPSQHSVPNFHNEWQNPKTSKDTTFKWQGNSLNNEIPPPGTEQTQKVVDRENLIYSTAVELQSLINALVQNLVNNVDDPSKLTRGPVTQVPECKVESLPFQLGCSTYFSEGLHDQNLSQPARGMSTGHASPEEHNELFTFSIIRDRPQPGVDAQRVGDQHLHKTKKEMGLDQHSTPMKNDYTYRRIEDKQEAGLADQRASDPVEIVTKIRMGDSPHRSQEGYRHSLGYAELRDGEEPCVEYSIIDPHEKTKKGTFHGQPMSPKENHQGKERRIEGKEQSTVAAQGAYNPHEIKTKNGRECSPQRSPIIHNHSLRHRKIRDKPQPCVNAQRACDQYLNSLQKKMAFDNLLTPKGNNHLCQHRVTGGKGQSGLADQRTCDSDQNISCDKGYCPHRNPKWHKLSFRYRKYGEKTLSCVNAQRTPGQYTNSVNRRRGYDSFPTPKRNNRPHVHRVTGDKQQSGLGDLRACGLGQIKKKDGMGSIPYSGPEGYNLLCRYRVIENNQEPVIVLRVCEPYESPKEGMDRDQPRSPEMYHSVKYRSTGGQERSGVAAQAASDWR